MEIAKNKKRVRFSDDVENVENLKEVIRLETLCNVFFSSEIALTERKKMLAEKEDELNQLHGKVWMEKNAMYDNFWNFSNGHDFHSVMTKLPKKRVKCICWKEEEEKQTEESIVSKLLQDPEITKIKSKIENLEAELKKLQSDKIVDQEIEKLKLELVNLHQESEVQKRLKDEIPQIRTDLNLLRKKIETEKQRKSCEKSPHAQETAFEKDFYHSFSSLFSNEDSIVLESMDTEKECFGESIEDFQDNPKYIPNPQIYGFVKARTLYLENKKKSKLHHSRDDVSEKKIKLENVKLENQKTTKFVVKRQSQISQNMLKNVKNETPSALFDWESNEKETELGKQETPKQKSTFVVKKQSEILRRLSPSQVNLL